MLFALLCLSLMVTRALALRARARGKQLSSLNVPFLEDVSPASFCCRGHWLNFFLAGSFVFTGMLWFLLTTMAIGGDSWWWRLMLIFSWAASLAAGMIWRPDAAFNERLGLGLPYVAASYTIVAIVQLSVWSYISTWLSSLLVFVILVGMLGSLLARRVPLSHDQDGNCCTAASTLCRRISAAVRLYRVAAALGLLACAALAALVTLTTADACMAFYNPLSLGTTAVGPITFNTWLSRAWHPPSCPAGPEPCHVYLTVPYNISEAMIVNAHTHPDVPPRAVFYGTSDGAESGNWTMTVPMRRYAAKLEWRGQRDVAQR
jgi:hypothetical protein